MAGWLYARAHAFNITCLYTKGAGPEHNTAKLYASARTRPLNSRPRALALAMQLILTLNIRHNIVLRVLKYTP